MDILYKNLMEHIKSTVPEIAWIDLDMGQLEVPKENYAIPFPCCLIEFEDYQPQSVGRGVQVGDLIVKVRLAFDYLEETDSLAPEDLRNSGLVKLQLVNKLYDSIQGFSGQHFNKLDRFHLLIEKTPDSWLKIITQRFKCNMRDSHAIKQTIVVGNVGLKVTNE